MMPIIQKVDFATNTTTSIFTPSINVDKFKQQAKKIRKEQGLSHHEALDLIAKKYKYHHWHHVTEMANLTEPLEKAFRQGFVIAYDFKEAEYVGAELFKVEDDLRWFCENDLWKSYQEIDDKDDPEFKELDEEEKRQYFNQDVFESMIFFRYVGKRTPANLKNALKLIHKSCFWSPEYVWLKGTFYDTFFEPSKNENGNIVAVRF